MGAAFREDNKIVKTLFELGISTPESLVEYYPRVRDRKDLKVLKCLRSGVLVLSRSDHVNLKYYEDNAEYLNHGTVTTIDASIPTEPLDDDARRVKQWKTHLENRRVLDVGCGTGSFIMGVSEMSRSVSGIEPNAVLRNRLASMGYDIRRDVSELRQDETFDVITLNHVFEHLVEPLETMKALLKHLDKDGLVIIEVPHSRDFLLNTLDLESFKSFTFWSEHLILHTEGSLRTFLLKSGFSSVTIAGYQRYPISNHFYWIMNGKPGGHKLFDFLNDKDLMESYSQYLLRRKETDTLISYCKV